MMLEGEIAECLQFCSEEIIDCETQQVKTAFFKDGARAGRFGGAVNDLCWNRRESQRPTSRSFAKQTRLP